MEPALNYFIKSPQNCYNEELYSFHELLVKGKKVQIQGLENRIANCFLLGFCSDQNNIIAVSAIKRPLLGYVHGVIEKANLQRKVVELSYELGYSFTESEYRRKGINTAINSLLFENMKNVKGIIFATTAIQSSHNFLIAHSFKQMGNTWDGTYDKNLNYYERDQSQ
jgi:hypothetical protein